MPSDRRAVELEVTLRDLGHLMEEKLYTLSSREAQERIASAKDILSGLLGHKPPPTHLKQSTGFFGKFYDRLSYYLRNEVVGATGSASSKWVYGAEALQIRLSDLDLRMKEAPEKVPLKQVEEMHPWRFLMNEKQVEMLASWVKKLCQLQSGSKRSALLRPAAAAARTKGPR